MQPDAATEITLELNAERKSALDRVAAGLQCDRSTVVSQAIDAYVDLFDWQIEHINKGVADVQAGRTIGHEELKEKIAKRRAGRVVGQR